jgi:(R,R)-butanediol dehydrogenase / meso-butanediol dehydrogenase / diacetyl reductase
VSDKTGQTMRAARWHNRRDVRIEEVPVPTPRADQVLVEVEWCGICGTDLEEYRDGPVNIPLEEHPLTRHKAPITLGHEIVGKVVEAARDGSGPPEGARVIPDVVLGCGECWWCQRHEEGLCERGAVVGLHADGGLAQYVVATASTCVAVRPDLDAKVAALTEPTSVAVRALRKVPDPLGSSLLVIGAGTIGLLVIQWPVRLACPPSLLQIRSHNAANWRSRWEPTLPPNQISFENFSRTLPQGSVPTSLSSARGFRVSQSRRYA